MKRFIAATAIILAFLPAVVLADYAGPVTSANRANLGVGPYINITDSPYNVSATASDNAAGLQAAITAAVTAGQPLYIPVASSCYKYTAPLTIAGNLKIIGEHVTGNWAGSSANINLPAGTPPLAGSVLCPTSNGSDAIDITGDSLSVSVENLGIQFQTVFAGTGDAFHYVPTLTQGLSGSTFRNVIVYGHDGNHWAFNFQNLIYNTFEHIASYGGGGVNLFGTGVTGNYGNSDFYNPILFVFVGGTNGPLALGATALNNLGHITMFDQELGLVNQSGVTPGGNVPTNAQLLVTMDANVTEIFFGCGGGGGNIANMRAVVNASNGNNFFSWPCSNWVATTIDSPAWTTRGIALPAGNPSQNYKDNTSSGTVPIMGMSAFPATTVSATNATTYTHAAALYVPASPVASTNVTITAPHSIYAAGEIFTASDFSSAGGAFLTGTAQVNHNAGAATTQIADGTTSGALTLGATSNTTTIRGANLTLTDITTGTNADVLCITAGKVVTLQAAASCTISSMRFKHDIQPVSDDLSLQNILSLKPATYFYNNGEENIDKNAARLHVGLIAEDVERADPRLAVYEPDMKTVKAWHQDGMIAELVGAVKAQQRQIDSLKRELHAARR